MVAINTDTIKKPAFKWAGGKASSGVAEHLIDIYEAGKHLFPHDYVIPFAGALGDVYRVKPESFIAIDSEPIVVLTNQAFMDSQTLWPIGTKERMDFEFMRASFNAIRSQYLDAPLERRPVEFFKDWSLPNDLFLEKHDDPAETFTEDMYYLKAINILTPQQIFNAVREEANQPDLAALSSDAKAVRDFRTDCERQLFTIFLWLNKNCFNGLYRVNQKGNLNVTVGSRKVAFNAVQSYVNRHSEFLSRGEIHCADYTDVRDYLKHSHGNVFYLDPPYAPNQHFVENNKKSFKYSASGFDLNDQTELCLLAAELVAEGNLVVASNSDNVWLCDLYAEHGFHVRHVSARRRISCKGETRNNVTEMLALGMPNGTNQRLFDNFLALPKHIEEPLPIIAALEELESKKELVEVGA
jgi:DNA adenine methylase Dam